MGLFSSNLTALPAESPTFICCIGGPGCGKTTQAKQIVEEFDFVHVSTGKLLREAIEKKSISNWKEIKDKMDKGQSIDSEVVTELLIRFINRQPEKKIVLDNFPMSEDNYETWNILMQKGATLHGIFLFEITEDEMKKRLLARGERVEDNEESINQRIRIFNYETKPLIEIFRNRGKVTIFEGNKSKEVLFEEVKKEIITRKLYK